MDDLLAAARAELPEIEVSEEGFRAFAATRDTTHVADLYLAFACLEGNPAALRAFEARHGAELDRVVRELDKRGLGDDVRQILRQRLFVAAPGATAKIATYSGRGPLRRWVRVAASRIVLELVHAKEAPADDDELGALPDVADGPELAYLKARYRVAYKAAFADALARLGDRERTLLAQYHVDALTIDDLGALYGVHRVTALRRVGQAQRALRDSVLALLRERLGVSGDELASVTRLVRSQLTISLRRAAPKRAKRPGIRGRDATS